MATAKDLDFSKMSVEEMLALSSKLAEQAKVQSQKLFDDTLTLLNDKLKGMGRTKAEAIAALVELMDADERQAYQASLSPSQSRGNRQAAVKQPREKKWQPLPGMTKLDQDKSSARPELNTTYNIPGGEPWKTGDRLGRTPDYVVEALHKGALWADIKKK